MTALSTFRPTGMLRKTDFRNSLAFVVFLLVMPLVLFIDRQTATSSAWNHQWIANALGIALFLYIFAFHAPPILRKLMLYGIPVAVFGETLFSLVLGMYEYRLGSIPLYVFVGHSTVFAAVYLIGRVSWVRDSRRLPVPLFSIYAVLAIYWLIEKTDVFGFACFIGFLIAQYRAKTGQRFYLIMFGIVAYVELIGTYFGCWSWPETWFGLISWVPSGNPPIGIALFYFLFDLGCLWIYKQRNLAAWKRVRNIQRLRAA